MPIGHNLSTEMPQLAITENASKIERMLNISEVERAIRALSEQQLWALYVLLAAEPIGACRPSTREQGSQPADARGPESREVPQ